MALRQRRSDLVIGYAAAATAAGSHEKVLPRLRELAAAEGDSATDVRSVFSWSYHNLSAPAARLFRLAGLHPGPSLSTEAAALEVFEQAHHPETERLRAKMLDTAPAR